MTIDRGQVSDHFRSMAGAGHGPVRVTGKAGAALANRCQHANRLVAAAPVTGIRQGVSTAAAIEERPPRQLADAGRCWLRTTGKHVEAGGSCSVTLG